MPTASSTPARAGRVRRWLLRGLGGFVAIVLLVLAAVYGLSARRMSRQYDVHRYPLAIAADSATIARGRHVATIRGCVDCHGADLSGRVLVDDAMLGRLAPPNLTRGAGGRGATLTAADWERAIRHGVGRNGRSLFVMPAGEFQQLTDEDVTALVSYAMSVQPVDHATPVNRLGPLGRTLMLAGKLPALPAEAVEQGAPHAKSIVVAPTVEFGRYLAMSCTGCHGAGYSGGPRAEPGSRPARNISPDSATGIGRWSEADFVTALRTARRPDGAVLDTTAMPVPLIRQMTDVELTAIYRYLRTVPARAYGNH